MVVNKDVIGEIELAVSIFLRDPHGRTLSIRTFSLFASIFAPLLRSCDMISIWPIIAA
jgi:hypothetical protein